MLIFWLGTRLSSFTPKQRFILGLSALGIFIIYGYNLYLNHNEFVLTQYYKYPPALYYTSYGVFASLLAYTCSPYLVKWISELPILEKVWIFVAQNTLWIYLYHIIFITFVPIRNIPSIFVRFVLIFILSAGTF